MTSLILTRAPAQNAAWAKALAEQGIASVALPLLELGARRDAAFYARRDALLQDWSRWWAVMHVSPNAVAGLWESPLLARWQQAPQRPRLWAPGPGTVQALQDMGVEATAIDQPRADAPQFDSEALWEVVAPQLHHADGRAVLIVRGMTGRPEETSTAFDAASGMVSAAASGGVSGATSGATSRAASPVVPGAVSSVVSRAVSAATPEQATEKGSGRDWLAQRLHERGVEVDFLPAYWRACPRWGEAERALAEESAREGRIWLLSSSEGARFLPQLLPDQDWQRHRAIATHPRIAQTARQLGFGTVEQARPTPQAVAQAVRELG